MVMIIVGCVKVYRKTNERILCKLSQSEILRLYSIVHVAMETTKTSNFSLGKFQFVSCNLSLAIIWQMTYTQKLPKLCLATLMSSFFLITLPWAFCRITTEQFLYSCAHPDFHLQVNLCYYFCRLKNTNVIVF